MTPNKKWYELVEKSAQISLQNILYAKSDDEAPLVKILEVWSLFVA